MVADRPTVSVILPVRNEAGTIERALASVLSQEYPRRIEVVVADGMSTDGTRQVLERVAAADPRVRLVDNPAQITPVGLNLAIRASGGEIVVRCDGHNLLPPGYIARAIEILLEAGADNVGGIQAATGEKFVERAIALAMSIPMGVGDARFHYGGPPGPADTVFLGVFRRSALDRIGGFDERLARNQDAELNHRIRATGGIVYFHPDLRVTYRPRGSLHALWRQYFSSGAWKRETFRRSPGSFRLRQAAPPILVIGLAVSVVVGPLRPVFSIAVPALYIAVLVGTSIVEGVRKHELAASILLVVLPIMHLGWGLGFLVGRVRHREVR